MRLYGFIIVLFAAVCIRTSAYAQGAMERNDSVFALVKTIMNKQNGDELYTMLNDGFKAKFTNEKFTGILKSYIYPLGPMKTYKMLKYSGGMSYYKADYKDGSLEFMLVTDSFGKIAGFVFKDYKEPVASKTYTVATDNPLQTVFDKTVDTIARKYINKITAVGLSIGILNSSNMYTYGYGETKKGSGTIPDINSIFEIGSISKTFTATLLAHFVLLNKIALDDPITKYLPDSVAANKELQSITIQMLSNHTSGLSRIPDNLFDKHTNLLDPYKNYDEKKLFAYLQGCKPENAPGTTYGYSNLAVGLLGWILEHVSGKKYEQLFEDIICHPIGMNSTIQHPNDEQKTRLVTVYNDKGDAVLMWELDALAGAGAIRSTTKDMLRYTAANMSLDNNPIYKEVRLVQKTTYDKEQKVGLGWHMASISGTEYFHHAGGTGGCRSFVAYIPGRNIAVVVLANSEEGVDDVGIAILKRLL